MRPSVFVLAAAVALLAGCTGGGRPRGVSTTTRPTTTVLSDQCPATPPSAPPAALNVGVSGLDKKLVPIAAATVRVCRYPEAVSPLFYDSSAAVQFEAATNGLSRLPTSQAGMSCGARAATFVVTFVRATQRVVVVAFCGAATNGAFAADPTAKWVDSLQTPRMGFPSAPPVTPTSTTG